MKSFFKKYKFWIIGVAVVLALAVAYKVAMPFKYLDDSKYTYAQRRAIVKIMKEIDADSTQRKALEDAAKAGTKVYRQLLEEAAAAKYLAENPE